MRARRGIHARRLSAVACIVCTTGLAVGASATEYFSWIDRSGTMVLTDDLSSLPPDTQRSAITVHRFVDRPSVPAQSPDVTSNPDQVKSSESPGASTQEESKPAADPRAVSSADLDLPNIRLDTPDEGVKWQYAWVPLTMPIYHGGKSINGFWAHHNAGSPFAAFSELLQRNAGQSVEPRVIGGRIGGGNQHQAEIPSEIRFMRGLLALSERMIPPTQPIHTQRSPQPSGNRSGQSGAGR
jgi:hypothetical protein